MVVIFRLLTLVVTIVNVVGKVWVAEMVLKSFFTFVVVLVTDTDCTLVKRFVVGIT